ncbi:MAG: hypothetical protein H7A40_00020 [Chlamydiales bacterium]|nr:hypothetical protein [Chlamydiales bacterium]
MTSNGIGNSDQGMHFELLPKQYRGMTGTDDVGFVPINIPTGTFNGMVQNLTERFDNIDAIHRAVSSALDEIEKSQTEHAQGYAKIRADQERIRADQERIRADQEEIREGFAEIRADQEEIGEGFAEIREDQKEVRAGIERLDIGIKEVGADHVRLNAKVEELERRVSFIEARELEMGDSGEPFLPLMQKVQRILDYVVSAGSRFKSYACLSSGKDWVKVAIGLCAIVAVSALFFAGLNLQPRAIIEKGMNSLR